jgi:hypothetical protein
VPDRANTTGQGYGPSTARTRAGLVQSLLNGSCLGPARYTRPIWPSVPPHNNDGPRLMPPPLRHPILGRERRGRCLLPVFIRHQPRHRLTQWLLHVHEDISHHAHHRFHRRRTYRTSSRPSPCSSSPTCCPAHGRSREPTDARRRRYGASWSCSCHFCVRAVEEDMVAPVTLRLS